MSIGDIMTRNVHLVRPEETLQYAASLMAEWDIAFLPVADASGLVGTLTDRDIILRALNQTQFNRTQAASLLGISVRQLRYQMQKLDIHAPEP